MGSVATHCECQGSELVLVCRQTNALLFGPHAREVPSRGSRKREKHHAEDQHRKGLSHRLSGEKAMRTPDCMGRSRLSVARHGSRRRTTHSVRWFTLGAGLSTFDTDQKLRDRRASSPYTRPTSKSATDESLVGAKQRREIRIRTNDWESKARATQGRLFVDIACVCGTNRRLHRKSPSVSLSAIMQRIAKPQANANHRF